MCFDCGCLLPAASHGDSRHITEMHLQSAADANHTDIPTVIYNFIRTLSVWRGRAPAHVPPPESGPILAAKELALKTVQMEKESQYTLGLAYPANRVDRAVAADGHRDFAPAEVLENAAWNFMRKGAKVGLLHRPGTEGQGTVVESYIYRGPDWEIVTPSGEKTMIKAGDWLMGIIWNTPAWEAIKRGKLTGLSPQAKVKRRIPSQEALAGLRSD